MKQSLLRQVSICLLTLLSVGMSTATFACPTLSVSHVASAMDHQPHVDFHWHNKDNPTGNSN